MATTDDPTLDLLVTQGLISIVQTDDEMRITAVRGQAAHAYPVGVQLCEAVPVLFGMEEAVQDLGANGNAQLVLTNISIVQEAGLNARQDFVVVRAPADGGYVLMITPSLANDELGIELEQNLREKLRLESQVARQSRAIAATNDALKRANADLMNFTRIISHDLKAPMRAIRYSAEDIGSSIAATGGDAQLAALDELRQQSVRLSSMVTDLLTYSRLGDKSTAAAAVATAKLVDEVVRSLPRPDGFQIEVSGDWPEVETIGVLLDIVLRNLIDNALKHHDREDGTIRVAAKPKDTLLEIVVSDDGPGIPDDYRQAVLRPFVKLAKDDHESSGLGLSMVDKVIREVGGDLNIGHRPDGRRGTQITVRWPYTIVAT